MPDILQSAKDTKLLPPSKLENLDLPYSSRGGAIPPLPQPVPAVPPPVPKKRGGKPFLLAVFLFLLVTVPLSVAFITKQQQLTDPRSRAGQCESGGQPHEYNECCGQNKSRHVVRTCVGGQFQWKTYNDCEQEDSACGPPPPPESKPPSCKPGEVFADGQCHNVQGCTPDCNNKGCGAPDGCSGVCTESCETKQEANTASNQGPQPQQGGGIINAGNATNDACTASGSCAPSGGQTMKICKCDALEYGQVTAICTKDCQDASGTVNCQSEADANCKVVQLDVYSGGSLVDTVVCTPNKDKCAAPAPLPPAPTSPPAQQQQSAPPATQTAAPTPAPTSTPTPIAGPQCKNIKIYKGDQVVIPSDLVAGDAVEFAVVGANATKARVRVNGSTWTETTAKNTSNEFIIGFTVPSSGGTFTVEAEVHQNGAWQ